MKLHHLTILFILIFSTAQANEETIVQDVHYYSPNTAKAYLVWAINDWQLPDSSLIDTNTYELNGMLYTPMRLEGDTLKVSIVLPVKTTLRFMFWLTETREGGYIDIWDNNLGNIYKHVIGQINPILVVAQQVKRIHPTKPVGL